MTTAEGRPTATAAAAALALAVAAALLWAYWPTLRALEWRWSHDPRYSHGYLVPAFSLFLLWHRRGRLAGPSRPLGWTGLALVAAGSLLRPVPARLYYNWGGDRLLQWAEVASLLACLAGLAALVGGRSALRWAAPSLGFLVLMVPLPTRIEEAVGDPLRQLAAAASTYALQTLGVTAVRQGTVILLDDTRVGVAEACNGLGMLYMFLAYSVAAALLVRGPGWVRVAIVASSLPIALAANLARITITGLLHAYVGGRYADTFYHDLAGWLMMPLALAAFFAELRLLSGAAGMAGSPAPPARRAVLPEPPGPC